MTTATTPSHQPATAEDLTPRAITVIAWPDPVIDNAAGSIPTASDDALIPGAVRIFDSLECALVAVREGLR